jgi:hypothetical protein
MALKAMLAAVAKGEELKFEYIGTDDKNGTLIMGSDIKSVARTLAKTRAGIDNDSKIAKGTCVFREETYTFVCPGIKPKKAHVTATIKRADKGFSDHVKIVGLDGKEDESDGGQTSTPQTTGGTTTPRPQQRGQVGGSRQQTQETRTTQPQVDEALVELKKKVEVLLEKVTNAIPTFGSDFTGDLEKLQNLLQVAGGSNDTEKVQRAYDKAVETFLEIAQRVKESRTGTKPKTETPKTETRQEPSTNGLPALRKKIGDLLQKVEHSFDVLGEDYKERLEKVQRLLQAAGQSPLAEKAQLAYDKAHEEFVAIVQFAKESQQTPKPSTTKQTRSTPPPQQPPSRDLEGEERVLREKTLDLVNNLDLPEGARVSSFVNAYNSMSSTFREIDGVTDVAQRLQRRQELYDRLVQFSKDAPEYDKCAKRIEVAFKSAKQFIATPRPGVVIELYNQLVNDSNALNRMTDMAQALVAVKKLDADFQSFNSDREKLAKDCDEAAKLSQEFGKAFPQRKYLDRYNNAKSASDLRGLLTELQQIKREGPAKAKQALSTLKGKTDEDIKLMPAQERIELLTNLKLGDSKSESDCRKAMARLYKAMVLEDDFANKDREMRTKVLTKLKTNEVLLDAKRTWTEKSTQEKVEVLRTALRIQCGEMGIPENEMPEITLFSEPSVKLSPDKKLTLEGFFSPSDGKIYLNDNRDSFKEDFDDSLDTIIHENTHNYQHKLVKKLEEGLIKEGDPEYNQAILFQFNFANYLDSKDEGHEAYEKQPTEMHAWTAGREAHMLFLEDATTQATILIGKIKKIAEGFPAFARELRPIQEKLEKAVKGKKSGPIEKATEDATREVNAIAIRIKNQQKK